MAKRRGGRKNKKTLKIILGVLGVAAAGVIGYILYQRSKQPGTSPGGTSGVQVWRV